MAEVVNMPKLGFDMAEGTLVRWIVQEGVQVQKGDVLAEIETDKATIEVETSASGVILKHVVGEGTAVPVGEPIAIVGEADEQVDLESLLGKAMVQETAAAPQEAAGEPAPALESSPVQALERARDARQMPDGRLPGGVRASPLARRLAAELDVDLAAVAGSGPGGRIVKQDVERALEEAEVAPPQYAPAARDRRETARVPLSRLRSAIGSRMTAAKQQLPHFYVTTEIDAGPLMSLRKDLNEALPDEAPKISVNDFIVKAAAHALDAYPNLNASLDGEQIVRHGQINVGVAVAVEDGLLTVVVRDADLKPLRLIAEESKAMIDHARAGKVRPEEIEGSTFTVSNLGMYDVDHFIAIINPPEAAILAVGSVRDVPVVEDGEIVIGRRLKVTLSADHRVTDGAEAAEWLRVFSAIMEQPLRLLI